mgnify:CR=1 FL=1
MDKLIILIISGSILFSVIILFFLINSQKKIIKCDLPHHNETLVMCTDLCSHDIFKPDNFINNLKNNHIIVPTNMTSLNTLKKDVNIKQIFNNNGLCWEKNAYNYFTGEDRLVSNNFKVFPNKNLLSIDTSKNYNFNEYESIHTQLLPEHSDVDIQLNFKYLVCKSTNVGFNPRLFYDSKNIPLLNTCDSIDINTSNINGQVLKDSIYNFEKSYYDMIKPQSHYECLDKVQC